MLPISRCCFAIAAGFSFLSVATAAAETRTIPASVVVGVLDSSLGGTQIHLNNYGARHGDSWHAANASFVRLSSALGGGERRFNIPELTINARVKLPLLPDPKYTAKYYVSNLDTSSISATALSGAIQITISFESRGTELKGRCTRGCVVGSDDTAPDFQVDRARIEVLLTPAALDGSISYTGARATFSARVDARGVGEFFDDRVKSEIKSRLEPAIAAALNDINVRRRVAAALRPSLDRLGIGRVTAVRMVGSRDIVVDFVPR